jgi:hypothetical protein
MSTRQVPHCTTGQTVVKNAASRGQSILRTQVFQQVVSLGPRCRAKHHIRLNFGHNISKRGAFDWQVTPPEALLEYFNRGFSGTFERADLEVVDGCLVRNRRYGTEHPHQFPTGQITEADLDRLYPAAKNVHEKSCQATRAALANGLSTLFVLGEEMPHDVVNEVRGFLELFDPRRRFEILLAPEGDQNTVDDWSGNPELWARHLAPYRIVPPISVRVEYQLYRIRKNLGYLLPV